MPDIDRITAGRRHRRLRRHDWTRRMVRESALVPNDLIAPLFVVEGDDCEESVASMPRVVRRSVDRTVHAATRLAALGVPCVALFPYIAQDRRDERGSVILDPDNLVCRACRAIKDAVPQIGVITDTALDPFTSHGHDGIWDHEARWVMNDASVEIAAQAAVLQAEAGADVIGPSDMMDGRVGAIREALDDAGHRYVSILSYTAKYASAFYGPYREAIGTQENLIGDKRGYFMDPANASEAMREAEADIAEGADMLMVKPGMPYLDIIARMKERFDMPVFAYQVSGEYAMIEAAAANGWIDGERARMEALLAFKRAGADGILTYYAQEIAERLNG